MRRHVFPKVKYNFWWSILLNVLWMSWVLIIRLWSILHYVNRAIEIGKLDTTIYYITSKYTCNDASYRKYYMQWSHEWYLIIFSDLFHTIYKTVILVFTINTRILCYHNNILFINDAESEHTFFSYICNVQCTSKVSVIKSFDIKGLK